MSYDALTISAVAIIAVLVFVIILVGKSRAATEIKMRNLANNLMLMQSNEDARAICMKIRKKYPQLCAGIDFTLKVDDDGAKIEEWYSSEPRPDL
jgi:pantothenate kinase